MSDTKQSGWVGWAVFGGIILIIAGVFDALFGLAAIIGPDSSIFLNTTTGSAILFDVQGWGWWHLIIGLALVLVGIFVLRGATWARITAVILVAINAIGQFGTFGYQPWWALAVIALDILVIFALVVHGKELRDR
ncbi:hypothetical protein ACH3VR_19270 [Microbacterium sp. B2969]|uniref:DUF7144 domain-containing protein n=1 Tax=Microbacterium alkaliflavum TaxID=3248839 RepID=A0ABW7QEA5_9MICO